MWYSRFLSTIYEIVHVELLNKELYLKKEEKDCLHAAAAAHPSDASTRRRQSNGSIGSVKGAGPDRQPQRQQPKGGGA